MANYLIHVCNDRLWYVTEYLIPSMINQGIDKDNINIYLDADNEGNLISCMKAFISVPKEGNTWHLQDDVIICSDFKERTEYEYEEDIICGFCFDKDQRKEYIGKVKQKNMWYSFPCICIPNKIARSCAKWFFNFAQFQKYYQIWINAKKYDDSIFDSYLQDYHPDIKVLNLMPNLVDHIDYLIGGSIANKIRPDKETHSVYFKDKYLVDNLSQILVDI